MLGLKITGLVEADHYANDMSHMIGLVDPKCLVKDRKAKYHVEFFHDVSENYKGYVAPSKDALERVFKFSSDLTDSDKLLIHCQSGRSRSSAVGIGVLIQHGMSINKVLEVAELIRPNMCPNKLIISLIDDIFSLNGILTETVDDWYIKKQSEMNIIPA